MRILVTGGAGFIGSHIVDTYINDGHEVAVVDNLYTGKKEFINPKATFFEVDIRDTRKVSEVFTTFRPEVLNHHAAQMDVRKSVAEPQFDAEINILGFLNLLESGRQNGLKKAIFASSGGAIYGDTDILPTPETLLPHPASPYGISKLTTEYYLDFYAQAYGIIYVALRYGNVYGPRQNPHGEAGVVAIFAKKLLKGEQPIINGDGTQTRDFVFVKDVVAANRAALKQDEKVILNIGTGKETDVNTIYDHLVKAVKVVGKRSHGPQKRGEQKKSCLDSSLAKATLGWNSEISLETGLLETVAYFAHEKNN